MYNLINKTTNIPTGNISWTKKYKFEEDEWGKIFSDPFKITKDSTVQWFQSRINHKILATNTLLYKMKLIHDPKCTFCYKRDETIEHLLWECVTIQNGWNNRISYGCVYAQIRSGLGMHLGTYSNHDTVLFLLIVPIKGRFV